MIRDATAADVPALARVAARSYAQAFAHILEPASLATYDQAYFESRFAGRWPRTRVAVRDDEVLAFCVVTGGHIDMLFTDPAATGAGIGAALLADAEVRGARTLECFEANKAAQRFYARHGWRVTRRYERAFAGRERRFVWMEKAPVTTGAAAPKDR